MVKRSVINQKYSNMSWQPRSSVKLKELIKKVRDSRGKQLRPLTEDSIILPVSLRSKICLHHRLASKSLEFN